MNIREIQDKDMEAVSAVCLRSFSKSIAPSLSEEGINTFSQIAASSAFCERAKADNLMYVAEENGSIKGVVELKVGRHIAMLFVDPELQRAGVGRQLLLSALRHSRFNTVTVSASLASIPAYKKYGFACKGEIAKSAGLVFQPMEIELNKNLKPGS